MFRQILAVSVISTNLSAGPVLLSEGGRFGFDDFRGGGFSAEPGADQLDSDRWRLTGASQGDGAFGGSFTTGDFARGTSDGSVTGGGAYAFDVGNGSGSPDWAVGVQATGADFTPGNLEMRVMNDGTDTVDAVWVDYEVHAYNDGDRSTGIGLFYQVQSEGGPTTAPQWVDAGASATTAARDSQPAWISDSYSILLDGLDLLPGAELVIGWSFDDESGSGSRDEIAFDDIGIRGVSKPPVAVGEPSLFGVVLAACAWMTRVSRRRRAMGESIAPAPSDPPRYPFLARGPLAG